MHISYAIKECYKNWKYTHDYDQPLQLNKKSAANHTKDIDMLLSE